MTIEEAKKFIQDIANGMGSMAMEYWSEKTGDKLREALDVLEQEHERKETVTEFADRCKECGARYGKLLKQKSEK